MSHREGIKRLRLSPLLGSESLGGIADAGHEPEALALAAGPSLKHVAVHPVDAGALAWHAAHGSGAAADGAVALPGVLAAHGGGDDMGKRHLDAGGGERRRPESGLHEGVADGDADGEDEGSEQAEHVEARTGCSRFFDRRACEVVRLDGWLPAAVLCCWDLQQFSSIKCSFLGL